MSRKSRTADAASTKAKPKPAPVQERSRVRSLRWRTKVVSELDTSGIRKWSRAVGFGRSLPVSGGVDRRNVGEEPIAATGNGLDEARILRRVAQRFTNLVDGFVEAVIEVDDRLAPKSLAQLFPGYQLSGLFQQHRQDLKRLLLQPDPQAALRQFARSKVDLEDTKP